MGASSKSLDFGQVIAAVVFNVRRYQLKACDELTACGGPLYSVQASDLSNISNIHRYLLDAVVDFCVWRIHID